MLRRIWECAIQNWLAAAAANDDDDNFVTADAPAADAIEHI